MSDRQSVAANAVVSNALSGKQFEFLPYDAVVTIGGTASTVGLNFTVLNGGMTEIDDQEVNAQNRLPILPDDVVTRFAAPKGSRLTVKYRNTTAGAITAFLTVDITPLK